MITIKQLVEPEVRRRWQPRFVPALVLSGQISNNKHRSTTTWKKWFGSTLSNSRLKNHHQLIWAALRTISSASDHRVPKVVTIHRLSETSHPLGAQQSILPAKLPNHTFQTSLLVRRSRVLGATHRLSTAATIYAITCKSQAHMHQIWIHSTSRHLLQTLEPSTKSQVWAPRT